MDVSEGIAPIGAPHSHCQSEFRFDFGDCSSEANLEGSVCRFEFVVSGDWDLMGGHAVSNGYRPIGVAWL